jgi:hypothetical protein
MNKIYILAYIMVTYNLWRSVVTGKENWLLVLKHRARKGFLALGFKGKIILDLTEERAENDHDDYL